MKALMLSIFAGVAIIALSGGSQAKKSNAASAAAAPLAQITGIAPLAEANKAPDDDKIKAAEVRPASCSLFGGDRSGIAVPPTVYCPPGCPPLCPICPPTECCPPPCPPVKPICPHPQVVGPCTNIDKQIAGSPINCNGSDQCSVTVMEPCIGWERVKVPVTVWEWQQCANTVGCACKTSADPATGGYDFNETGCITQQVKLIPKQETWEIIRQTVNVCPVQKKMPYRCEDYQTN